MRAINDMQDYIEIRLLEWADWSKKTKLPRLGYASRSLIGKLVEEGPVMNDPLYISYKEDDNIFAEQIDQLISQLFSYNEMCAKVIKSNYIDNGTQQTKAKSIGISTSQYKVYLNIGRAWITGSLTAYST